MTIWSAAVLLFLVMDPLGNVPLFFGVLKDVEHQRRPAIVLREMFFAFLVLVLFLFLGRQILAAMQVDEPALSIAGGIILFLVALRMIFPVPEGPVSVRVEEPFIVPLAVPLVAGPSAIATVLLLVAREPDRLFDWFFAVVLAWLVTTAVLLASSYLSRHLDRRVLTAIERLMGMILTTISVQMFLSGVRKFIEMQWPLGQ